jgi:hypothetical protein
MIRMVLIVGLMVSAAGCHTVPDPNDPDRQKRIDDCLKKCGGGEPERDNTAYPPAPSQRTDIRTPCERRCHGIP